MNDAAGKGGLAPSIAKRDEAPWGAHRPGAAVSLLLALTRHTPFGRGGMRAAIHSLLLKLHPGPLDCHLYGQKMRAYLSGNRCEWKAVLNPELFDPLERALTRHVLDCDRAVMLDIGANVGIHALAAAGHVRDDARIIAFEPHPDTFMHLKFNLNASVFKGFVAVQAALSDSNGEVELSGDDHSLISMIGDGGGPLVPMRRLLTCLEELHVDHVDLMKIDVEGCEDRVLGDFLDKAPDSLVPQCVIIEHLGKHLWSFDCIAGLEKRNLEKAAVIGNNTFMVRPGSRAAQWLADRK